MFLRAAAAAAGRVTQHLLIHGLLCSFLFRVFLHQLGKLRMDSLHPRDKTNRVSRSCRHQPNPGGIVYTHTHKSFLCWLLNYIWIKRVWLKIKQTPIKSPATEEVLYWCGMTCGIE